MADFLPAPDMSRDLIARANRAQWKDRRKGPPHVSDVVGCLRKAWLRRAGVQMPNLGDDNQASLLAGQAHHVILQSAKIEGLRAEVEVEDLSLPLQGNIDLILPYMDDEIPVEIKTTRASSKWDPAHWPHYIEQLASYCMMVDKKVGGLTVLHLLGNWSGAKQAEFKGWLIAFPDNEMAAWRVEVQRRIFELVQPSMPPIGEHATWECDYCPFRVDKGGPCEGGIGRPSGFFPMESLV